MTIHLPHDIQLIDLAVLAWRHGYDLYATRDAGIEFRPRNVAVATNCHRIKTLRRKRQRIKGVPTP